MLKVFLIRGFCIVSFIGFLSCEPNHEDSEGPSPALSAREELETFQVEPGFRVQLVASEPMVQEPVVITFDAEGRLWVVEMRGFMPDIDGNGEQDPVGRVSILEDHNGDGAMDTSWVYIDSLVMPRALAVVPGGALVVENQALWLTQDTNHDFKADTKTLVDPDYAGSAMPEHSGNGLWRGIDNWYYNAKSRFRYRLVEGEWIRDSTEFRGQWGISHDDKGRLYYNYNWSQLHADLVPPNQLGRNKNHTPTSGIDHGLTLDRRVYPIRANPAVNRGYIAGTLDNDGRLLEFTAACSPLVYRGDLFANEFHGNVFVCEPSGNLVKRNVVTEDGILLVATDPHPGTEFLASTDERFRPVFLTSGPDGSLYIADMYRGLIQHGAYVTPYLREQTLSRKLVQPIHCGRIWRVVPDGKAEGPPADKLSERSTAELVDRLSHPDGWHRDMAQRLIVERNDKTVGTKLTTLAVESDHSLARLHALWSLEGLGLLNADVLTKLISDDDPLIQETALRLIEPFAKADREVRKNLESIIPGIISSQSQSVILQVALTAHVLDDDVSVPLLKRIAMRHGNSPIIRDAVMSSLEGSELTLLSTLLDDPDWDEHRPYYEIFLETLTASVLRNNDRDELTTLMAFLTPSSPYNWKKKAVLTALCVQGNNRSTPITLTRAPDLLSGSNPQLDSLQRKILLSMFAWPGHVPERKIDNSEAILTDRDLELFTLGRQHYLTSCAGCHGTDGAGMARFAPPLVDSEWVLGNEKRLALLVLHGMEGPVEVNGKKYDVPDILTVMPAHSTLDDRVITAILTYIRNAWGNQGGPLTRGVVGSTRHTSQGRVMPWTAAELNEHIEKVQASTGKLAKD